MDNRNYWLDLFSGKTWQEFIKAGADVSGFRENRWAIMKRIKKGDYFLCYLTGVSRFIGILEVMSEPFKDSSKIWSDDTFPCRLKVKLVVGLTPETAIPILELRDELSIFKELKSPHAWVGLLRGSPTQWKPEDGEIIVKALLEAKENPKIRPVDMKKLERRPPILKTKIGAVTVPETDDIGIVPQIDSSTLEVKKHTEIQYLLLKLGIDMGFNVWVARNDRSREMSGKKFSEAFKLKEDLPLQFDEATTRTIEHIDVLWLKGNAIVAAFEIESTTSIYSGLLRMSDLVAMQPNLNIPLYLVAPDERRQKVIVEVNRPTFMRLSPPLVDVCRFISFNTLQEQVNRISSYVRYLKPEFLEEISEACDIGEI